MDFDELTPEEQRIVIISTVAFILVSLGCLGFCKWKNIDICCCFCKKKDKKRCSLCCLCSSGAWCKRRKKKRKRKKKKRFNLAGELVKEVVANHVETAVLENLQNIDLPV